MLSYKITAALAAAAALASVPVHAADGHATASITNFTYQLIDLDPNDGITPSIVFEAPSANVSTTINNGLNGYVGDYLNSLGAVETVAPHGVTRAEATLTSVSGETIFTSTTGFQGASGWTQVNRTFSLSPSTGFLFTAAGSVFAEQQGLDNIEAYISLSADLRNVINNVYVLQSSERSYRISEGSRDVSLVGYLASGSIAATGHLNLWAQTSGTVQGTSPVPEPTTWGMLAAGLVAIGAARRRKVAAVTR